MKLEADPVGVLVKPLSEPDGFGKVTLPGGIVCQGTWREGILNGKGTITEPGRGPQEALWQMGKFKGRLWPNLKIRDDAPTNP